MSTQEFKSSNGKIYMVENGKIFEYQPSSWRYVLVALVVVFLGVLAYDWFKDVGREVSGYRDIFSGKASSGVTKLFGFTSGNIKRTVLIIALAILIFVVFKYENKNKREITINEVPQDVKTQVIAALNTPTKSK